MREGQEKGRFKVILSYIVHETLFQKHNKILKRKQSYLDLILTWKDIFMHFHLEEKKRNCSLRTSISLAEVLIVEWALNFTVFSTSFVPHVFALPFLLFPSDQELIHVGFSVICWVLAISVSKARYSGWRPLPRHVCKLTLMSARLWNEVTVFPFYHQESQALVIPAGIAD